MRFSRGTRLPGILRRRPAPTGAACLAGPVGRSEGLGMDASAKRAGGRFGVRFVNHGKRVGKGPVRRMHAMGGR